MAAQKKDDKSNSGNENNKGGAAGSAEQPEILTEQDCPFCHKKTLTMMERDIEVPYFGRLSLFSMSCSNSECNYHKADVESVEPKEPCRYTFEISSEEDMSVRVVKSSSATIKIPRITTVTPGPASNGYVTNIEGILNRVKNQVEHIRDSEEEEEETRSKAKNMAKKLINVIWGREKLKIIIEDPSGNSAIISERAVKEKMDVKA